MMRGRGFVVLLGVVAPPSVAVAEQRAFTSAYESLTMAKGEVQIDAPMVHAFGLGDDTTRTFQLQLDVAYGITDKLDIAAYQVYQEATDGDPMTSDIALHYEESRVRTRYRFSDRGEYPVDLVAYLDLVKSFRTELIEVAPRVIAARTFDRLTVVANAYSRHQFRPGAHTDLGWAAGITYEVHPDVKLGLEGYGEYRLRDRSSSGWVGPAGLWAPSAKAWVNAGVAFGVTEASIDLRTQFSVGLRL